MKRIIMLLMMLALSLMPSSVFADYPEFLNGDKNCILCGGHMGSAIYVVKDSVRIVENNYPWVKLTFDYLNVGNADRGNIYNYKRKTMSYLYNQEKIEMYAIYDDGTPRYRKPYGKCMADIGHFYPGETAYCIAFNKAFYGAYRWAGENGNTIHAGLGCLDIVRRSNM